jgi:hypothetical protein
MRARRQAQFRRRRVSLAVLILVIAGVAAIALSGGSTPKPASSVGHRVPPPASGIAAVESGELPWQLAAPISREVVLADAVSNRLLILGGLGESGSSDSGIYALSTATGALTNIGSLNSATHDASGAVIGSTAVVFGGGTVLPSATAQRVALSGTGAVSASLPQARADSAAVTIGKTAYVVGGYAGSSFDAQVLSTTDGSHFNVVADLPVAVRYAAVAVYKQKIYVFGGQASDGRYVTAIQTVNPTTHKAVLVATLPSALSGAVAATLGGTMYIAGGETETTSSGPSPTSTIYAFSPETNKVERAGSLQLAVTNAGAAVLDSRLWIVGGETSGGKSTAAVQILMPNRKFGVAGTPGAGSPFYGDQLLIADRGNNRLLLLNSSDKITWEYPSKKTPGPNGGFYFPDDAFFTRHGTGIISNQESNETIVQIAFPSGKITWTYGHPRTAGSAPGYLNNPDDAYLLKNGDITVADPKNCRVLVISEQKKVLRQIGTPGSCVHGPPTMLGSPNGDTPLVDGNLLVSEINGSWIDEYSRTGHLVWTVHLSIGYPSDPQQIGPNRYLVANYEKPGSIIEFDRSGHILYRYGPTSGVGSLNQPSLVELLPSGVFMLNDDYNDRMVAIDPASGAVVWQYGKFGVAGTAPGLLNVPDGFDLLAPGGVTPTHPATG